MIVAEGQNHKGRVDKGTPLVKLLEASYDKAI